jgi:hypothetical protein
MSFRIYVRLERPPATRLALSGSLISPGALDSK